MHYRNYLKNGVQLVCHLKKIQNLLEELGTIILLQCVTKWASKLQREFHILYTTYKQSLTRMEEKPHSHTINFRQIFLEQTYFCHKKRHTVDLFTRYRLVDKIYTGPDFLYAEQAASQNPVNSKNPKIKKRSSFFLLLVEKKEKIG